MPGFWRSQQQYTSTKPGFRPEIQGLRAVAILAVVLYHAQLPGFAGGFVGVDVFFVISGFLICGLLARELRQTGRVALLPFWYRRARRLLPNALLVLASVLMVAVVLVPSYRRPSIAADAMAAAFNVANYRFAASAVDYFQLDGPASPLLHFWSLSIEEQFYIVWPPLLAGFAVAAPRRAIGWLPMALATILLGSFASSLWVMTFNQPLAFFHTGTRAWQLAAGGLLAVASPGLARAPTWSRELAGWTGLAAIIGCIVRYDDAMTYPGLAAVPPTVGAILVIGAGPRTLNRLLGATPLQWLGARSYSLYLWHWPALVFTGLVVADHRIAVPVGLAIAVATATAAHAFVEEPIHSGRALAGQLEGNWTIAATAIAVMGLFCLLVGAQFVVVPLPASAAVASMGDRLRRATMDHGENAAAHCHLRPEETVQPPCVFGATGGTHRAVLFGDSHASQWFAPLDSAAKRAGWRLNAWTKSSCPSLDMPIWLKPKRVDFMACQTWREDVLLRLTGTEKPDLVVLSNLTDYSGWVRDPASGALLSRAATMSRWNEGFSAVLKRLTMAGVRVAVIRDTPQAYADFADCLAAEGGAACDRPRAEAIMEPSPDVVAARTFAGVMVVDLTDRICGGTVCPVERDGQIVYLDRHHLTASFAATLSDGLADLFRVR